MNPSFDVLWQSTQSRPPTHLSRCLRLIDIILHNSQPCQLGDPSVISEPDCRVKMFQRFIGCPLSLKRLDVTTRMFGKLRPQGHAGKAGWDGILGRPMAALLPAEDTGGFWLGSHRGWHDRYEAYICMPLYLTSISRVVDSYRLSGCRKMLGRQAGEVPRFGPVWPRGCDVAGPSTVCRSARSIPFGGVSRPAWISVSTFCVGGRIVQGGRYAQSSRRLCHTPLFSSSCYAYTRRRWTAGLRKANECGSE